MKGKTKTQKGITLIALIITIIVLLILAVVAIRAVQGDGIIAHAKDARNKYSKAQIEETIKLLQYKAQLDTMGDNSLLTLEQINDQEWIKDESATAVQDETTGKITITIAKTGEQIEVEGKKTETEETYYWVGQNVKELYHITLKGNNQFEEFIKGNELGNHYQADRYLHGTYSYETETKMITFKYDEDYSDTRLNYMTLGNNKILYSFDDETTNDTVTRKNLYILTTNGTEGFQIPESGTYEGIDTSSNKYECSINNGVIFYKTPLDTEEGVGIIWDNVVYICCGEKGGSLFKISDNNLIGFTFGTFGVVFTKTSE